MAIPKIIRDTLMTNGKWSLKRLASFSAFWVAVCYVFLPVWIPLFIVHEFVFWGFMTFGASAIGMTVWNKKIDKNETNE